ncbi:family 16 glycoside hydrolase [Vallicoccus soli]|uniref:family 16 glycoside hydrolase n=1 Tax=Vallicoccus soli TaxID=2339232 RepID=UPI001C49B2B0|nr:family 16 glycoside hydrolase [Vallicoccus soli]
MGLLGLALLGTSATAVLPTAAQAAGSAALDRPAASAPGAAAAADLPDQEPGVTLRTYQLGQALDRLCVLKDGQTPNVDKRMPVVDWTTAEQFGAEDNFVSEVRGNLHVPADGEYAFRLVSDDGSRLSIDGQVVVDHDGLHGAEPKDGTTTLTAGPHALAIDFFEAGYGQQLTLQWRPPGAAGFTLVPESALSTDAGVVRVVAPGTKYCEGATDTAGDGLRLDAVNPMYDLLDLRPGGFEPMVAAMEFVGDDLYVVTSGAVSPAGPPEDPTPGEVFLLEGAATADSPDDVVPVKVASDLLNPMGIDHVDGSLYLSERDRLTKLVPDGDDPDELLDHETVAEWPYGGNFHEFAFGLEHDAESFYVSLSVAIDFGGATTNPQPGGPDRGTTIKVDRDTGEITYVAGGLRTPNGMGWGPGGELFVMDNQGGWLPSSKMVRIEQDRFFNHYQNPAGRFESQPVTPPVLWLPQNEIGNSPSNPVMLQEGPFAGQMVFGDVTYGGLQRAYLEKVGDDYQGAVFRHSAGLEAGINRTVLGPDGSLYVGGIGEAGNWSEPGKLKYGLQKLRPNGTSVFDIQKVEVTETGFDLTYTEPLSDDTVDGIAGAYRAQHWRYVPTPAYGGPKVDEEVLPVTAARVSADRRTVSIDVEGLEPGRVVHLRSPRSFTSQDGEELWSTEAWYTLNTLPGYVPPPDLGYYEAEEAALAGGAGVTTEHNGYSGAGFVDGFLNPGASVTFTAKAERGGVQPVHLRYANGPNPFTGTKTVSVVVNGTEVEPWALPSTRDWQAWGVATRQLDLREGTNTITVRFDQGDDGNVNLDALRVGATLDTCAPTPAEAGWTSLFDGTLASFTAWRHAGDGSFGRQDDCTLRTSGGLGLLWYEPQEFEDYALRLDWKLVKDDNGGVFVGFPNPGEDPWVAVDQGYEVQIDATDADDRTTGAIYTFQGADLAKVEEALEPVGRWNAYEIRVEGQRIQVLLNGVLVNDFTSTDPARDLAGFVGVQNHGGGETVSYRNIRIQPLGDADVTAPTVSVATAPAEPTGTGGWWTGPVTVTATAQDAVDPSPALEVSTDGTTWAPYAPVEVTEDGERTLRFRATDSAGNVSEPEQVVVKVDRTAPVAALVGGPSGTVPAGQVPAAPTCEASDATSGLAGCEVTGYSTEVGQHVLRATATDRAGLTTTVTRAYAVAAVGGLPAAPTKVKAVAADGSARVTWAAPKHRGGFTVTATPGGATCTSPSARTCVVTGLVNGTSYTFTVVANSPAGPSAPSAPSVPVTPSWRPGTPGKVSLAVSAKASCAGGRAVLAVHVVNKEAVKADVRITTPLGEVKVTGLAPGAAHQQRFRGTSATLAGGTASIAGYTWRGGTGHYAVYQAGYAGTAC